MLSPTRIPTNRTVTLACLLTLSAACAVTDAQDRVIDKRPYDEIKLRASAGGKTLTVLPLDLPGRRVPTPFPDERLTVQLTTKPGVDYTVAWSDIESVRLYERMILDEADSLTRQKKFNQAFDYFALLDRNYPDLPGLDVGIGRYLQANALDAYLNKQYDLALAILSSLHERSSNASGLGRAVDTVAAKIIDEYKQQRNWRAARGVLEVVEQSFGGVNVTVADRYRAQFRRDADELVREGATAYRNKDYRAARAAAAAAAAIVPGHRVAAELFRRIDKDHPTLTVGVRTLAPAAPQPRIDSPESLRVSRLARRTLTELTGFSPEGGVYTCPVGRVALDESGERFTFTLSPRISELAPFALARRLLMLADSASDSFDRGFASVTEGVGVDFDRRGVVGVDLTRPHVRPESLLRRQPLAEAGLAPTGVGFEVTEANDQHTVLLATAAGAVAEIEERYYAKDEDVLRALVRGDIDVLDRVMPWQLAAIRGDRSLTLGSYNLPTVHVLIPTKRSKLLDNRSLRRALLYGINRQKLLDELLLAGRDEIGFQLVSGPFPSGRALSDPIHYGYNDGVQPRPYDPRLGALLSALVWSQEQRREHGKEDPADRPFPKLTLAHNSDPVARAACQSIQMQLGAIGVPIELKEMPAEQLLSDDPDFDLRYAELAMWEPLADAARLLGPSGIAGRCSDPMVAALKRLDSASNWPDVSNALRDIHELAAGDLPVLPLWQTVNYYAYRRDLRGPTENAVSLYQTIEDWKP